MLWIVIFVAILCAMWLVYAAVPTDPDTGAVSFVLGTTFMAVAVTSLLFALWHLANAVIQYVS